MNKKHINADLSIGRSWKYALVTAILLLLDQFTKYIAVHGLKGQNSIVLIPGVLHLTYVENNGAAFGIFRNMQWIFILFAIAIMILVIWIFPRIGNSLRYYPLKVICCMLFSGAAGNMADRLFHSYVIDFIYVKLIDFPVFNLADIYICVSCFCFIILILFFYSDHELENLIRSKKKEEYLRELIETVKKERDRSDE